MCSNMSCQFPTIWVLTGVGKRYRRIDSVIAAAELLLNEWPLAGGQAYLGALQACLEVLQDRGSPESVAVAFLRAADDAFVSYIRVVDDRAVYAPTKAARRFNPPKNMRRLRHEK